MFLENVSLVELLPYLNEEGLMHLFKKDISYSNKFSIEVSTSVGRGVTLMRRGGQKFEG